MICPWEEPEVTPSPALCTGCGKRVKPPAVLRLPGPAFSDRRGRRWHWACAAAALAECEPAVPAGPLEEGR